MTEERWDMHKADREFSRFIRNRDGKCMNWYWPYGLNYHAEISQLECSHYWSRGIWITRFDPRNCMALCRKCHQLWENDKQGRYQLVMQRVLGEREYKKLQKKVNDYKYKNIPHITHNQMIEECRIFLKDHDNKRSVR